MKEGRLLGIGLLALLVTFVAPAHAAPLNFVDGVDGTLTESAPFPVLQLGIGANTVSGTSFAQFVNSPFAADFDSFEFTVPAQTRLVSISYASTVTNESDPTLASLRMEAFLDVAPSFASLACQEFFIVNNVSAQPTCLVPPGNTFDAALPLDAGTYLLFEGQFEASDFSDTAWNYTWTLTVDPIPEPGTLPLLCAGLLSGFVMMRRRSAHKENAMLGRNLI
jgi:hypothetical protein